MAGTMTGRVFNGRYQITARIGIGGMAEVYRAQDTVLGRTVAVKVMLPQYAENPDFARRFKQEAASAANLSSPYIVNIYDWGQDDGTYYIVMELIRGTDLKSGIKARGALNQRKVAEIGSQVCSALNVAHSQDIIHRDIKSQNIMVQPDGSIKVMDFGIARAKNSIDTQTSSVLGTAHYISPEQAQGKELDATSDIYSLGVVLFEAATGQLPFDGTDAISVAMKQVNELPPYPSDINPNIDPALEDIIMKALEKNPRNRFASANEMRTALNDYLAGRTPSYAGAAAETTRLGSGVRGEMVRGNGLEKTSVLPAAKAGEPNHPGSSAAMPKSYRQGNALEKDTKGTSRRGFIIGGVAALVVVVALAIAFISGAFDSFGGKEETDVPDITGKTVVEATSILNDAGFKVGAIDKSYDANAKDGQIISQDPKGGTRAAVGSKINLIVSLGAETVIVPDLSDMTAAEAQAELTKYGLVAHAGTAEYSSDVKVNTVISQSPKAGEVVTKGDSVEYILSLGAETVSVPNVVGYSQDGATSALKNEGFEVEVSTRYSNDVSRGVVISQNPSGGKLEKGETVTIVVSDGVDPSTVEISVPNVVGSSVSDAKASLQSAGFQVSISGPETETAKVSAQSATQAKKGDTITLTTTETAQTSPSATS